MCKHSAPDKEAQRLQIVCVAKQHLKIETADKELTA